MSKKKQYGKYTPEQFRKNLVKLESVFGQKKLAEKLGVNPSTLRRWKAGTTAPTKDKINKTNRIYGHNKEKVTLSGLKKKVKQTKKRQESYKKRSEVIIESVSKWIQTAFDDVELRMKVYEKALGDYVALSKYDPHMVQFIDNPHTPLSQLGKPAGIKFVTVLGTYNFDYNMEDESERDVILETKIPTLTRLKEHWTIEETVNYLLHVFHKSPQQKGKHKFNPKRFIGYKL